ncbi:hypothetical protein D3C86_1836350 [compost metagenome]
MVPVLDIVGSDTETSVPFSVVLTMTEAFLLLVTPLTVLTASFQKLTPRTPSEFSFTACASPEFSITVMSGFAA